MSAERDRVEKLCKESDKGCSETDECTEPSEINNNRYLKVAVASKRAIGLIREARVTGLSVRELSTVQTKYVKAAKIAIDEVEQGSVICRKR